MLCHPGNTAWVQSRAGSIPYFIASAEMHEQSKIEPHLPYKTGLDVTQKHPMRRTCSTDLTYMSCVLNITFITVVSLRHPGHIACMRLISCLIASADMHASDLT